MHFLSAVLKNGELFYLTTADIESSRGLELRKHTKSMDDLRGHGAIRWFYGIEEGKDTEYRNFKSPDNLPREIVIKIISGYAFCQWFGIVPPRILKPYLYTGFVLRAISLLKDFYEAKRHTTFLEYQAEMLSLQKESWVSIRDENNRMVNWRTP